MANLIQAYQAYSPRVKISNIVERNELIRYIADRTGLNKSTATAVLMEMHDALLHFTMMGRSVRLEGLGVFRAGIENNGTFDMSYLPDKEMINQMNTALEFTGDIKNNDMIGKSKEDFIERWNSEHPNDKIKEK